LRSRPIWRVTAVRDALGLGAPPVPGAAAEKPGKLSMGQLWMAASAAMAASK
jgi:hypothetical protein